VEDIVNEQWPMNVTSYVAQNTSDRRSAIERRTTRHSGYGASRRIRKRIGGAFGWIKTVAGQEKTRFPAGSVSSPASVTLRGRSACGSIM
jgi:hypothetical protein